MWKLIIFGVIGIILMTQHGDAVCNQCRSGFACISETEFQLCFDETVDTSITYTCPQEDYICTQLPPICMPRSSGLSPACQGKQNCVCDDLVNGYFTCTSRTTFTMCQNFNYTTTTGTCSGSQLCDVSLAKQGLIPCTNKCIDDIDDASICDFEYPVDMPQPTPSPPTPSPPTPSPPTPSPPTPSPPTPSPPTPSPPTPSPETPSPPTPSPPTPSPPTPSPPTPSPPTPSPPTPSPPTPSPPTESTTTTEIITVTPPINIPNQVCSTQAIVGRYPYPNDRTCTNYIYCYRQDNVLLGRDTPCPVGRFFNRDIQNCQVGRPAWCF